MEEVVLPVRLISCMGQNPGYGECNRRGINENFTG